MQVRPSETFRDRATVNVYSASQQSFDAVDDSGRIEFVVDVRGVCTDANPDEPTVEVAGTPIRSTDSPSKADNSWFSMNVEGNYAAPRRDPIQACNTGLAQRVQQGADRSALLRNGFSVTLNEAYEVVASLSCRTNLQGRRFNSDRTWIAADVLCNGSNTSSSRPDRPAIPAESVPAPARVVVRFFDSAEVVAEPAEYFGECPARIRFTATFNVNRRGTLTYQWVGEDGFSTDNYTANLDSAGEHDFSFTRTIRPAAPSGRLAGSANAGQRMNGFMRLRISVPRQGAGQGPQLVLTDQVPFTVTCQVAPPARVPARSPAPARPERAR
jgi:hypothetical protein